MSTADAIKKQGIPTISNNNFYKHKIGIVVSEWNKDITEKLYEGSFETLLKGGVLKENIITLWVPGSFELIYGANLMVQRQVSAVIVIGSIIKGETEHFHYICNAVANGIKDLNIKYNIPFIFCVLTDDNKQQAIDRSGGKYGNKGEEAAIAAIKMINITYR